MNHKTQRNIISIVGVSTNLSQKREREVTYEEAMSLAIRAKVTYMEMDIESLLNVKEFIMSMCRLMHERPQLMDIDAKRRGCRECFQFSIAPLKGFLLVLWLYSDLCIVYSLFLLFDFASGWSLTIGEQVGVYIACMVFVVLAYILTLIIWKTLCKKLRVGMILEVTVAIAGLMKSLGIVVC